MSSVFRRAGLGAIARVTQADAAAASGMFQLGVGAKDGCVKALYATAVLAELKPSKAVMACDVSAARQSLHRSFMMQEVKARCPVLERPLAVWYPQDRPNVHWWRVAPGDVREIESANGLDQGCPLASPAFGISRGRLAEEAVARVRTVDAGANLLQYADDTRQHAEPTEIGRAHV